MSETTEGGLTKVEGGGAEEEEGGGKEEALQPQQSIEKEDGHNPNNNNNNTEQPQHVEEESHPHHHHHHKKKKKKNKKEHTNPLSVSTSSLDEDASSEGSNAKSHHGHHHHHKKKKKKKEHTEDTPPLQAVDQQQQEEQEAQTNTEGEDSEKHGKKHKKHHHHHKKHHHHHQYNQPDQPPDQPLDHTDDDSPDKVPSEKVAEEGVVCCTEEEGESTAGEQTPKGEHHPHPGKKKHHHHHKHHKYHNHHNNKHHNHHHHHNKHHHHHNKHHKKAHEQVHANMSPEDLAELKKELLVLYPFLQDIWESMLVTDHSHDDIIVWVNEHFERLTLYPSEEILGRNCRFLQGRLTNKKTIKQIKKALEKRASLDVQILNYRKDGLPFWNCLTILPVDMNGKAYNIAIQKDITLLRNVGEGDPSLWTPPEVAMWLEYNKLPAAALQCVDHDVDGARLLALVPEDLYVLGVTAKADRTKLLALVEQIKEKKKSLFDEAKENAHRQFGELPASSLANETAGKNFWRRSPVQYLDLVFKCFFQDFPPIVLLIDKQASFKVLKKKVHDKVGRRLRMTFRDSELDFLELADEEDYQALKLLSSDGVLHVFLHLDETYTLKPSSTTYLSSLPTPIAVTDAFGILLYTNPACMTLFGVTKASDVLHCPLSRFIPELKPIAEYVKKTKKGKKKGIKHPKPERNLSSAILTGTTSARVKEKKKKKPHAPVPGESTDSTTSSADGVIAPGAVEKEGEHNHGSSWTEGERKAVSQRELKKELSSSSGVKEETKKSAKVGLHMHHRKGSNSNKPHQDQEDTTVPASSSSLPPSTEGKKVHIKQPTSAQGEESGESVPKHMIVSATTKGRFLITFL